MTKDELIAKLEDIEWEDFEVKDASGGLPKSIWETVSAFSNTAGGWILLGIKQTGKNFEISGFPNPEKAEQDFTSPLRSEKFNTKIIPKYIKHNFPEGTVLGFYIPLSDKKPVYFNTPANTFIRTASGDSRITKEEFDAMMRDQAFGTQTSKPVPDTDSSMIHTNSLKQYREYLMRVNPTHSYNKLTNDEFLRKLQIVIDDNLSYSGLLFLGKNDFIQRTFPDFRIDLLEIPGTSYTDSSVRYTFRLDEQENLWSYYFALIERIRKQVDLPFQIDTEGFSIEDYPHLEALREAVVNLLMHADYFCTAKSRIRIFSDRIEFFNPGALPKPLEKIITEDITMPRNPLLAKMFRTIRLAENAGYGFEKMKSGWKTYSEILPEFESGIDYNKATFYLPPKDVDKEGSTIEGSTIGGTIGSTIGGTIGSTIELTERQKEVLLLIIDNPRITIREVTNILGVGKSAIQEHFDILKEKGIIERIGGTRGFWKVKIKLD
jgi:ATP-dependent DNA helicase RecG